MAVMQGLCGVDWKRHGKNAMAFLVHTALGSAFLLYFFWSKKKPCGKVRFVDEERSER